MDKMSKDAVRDILKEGFKDYNQGVFEAAWKNAQTKDLLGTIHVIQPLINAGLDDLGFVDACAYAAHFSRFVNMGGDPEYFTCGAGAKDNCCVS